MSNATWWESVDFVVDAQPVMRMGDRGPEIKRLKEKLNHIGFSLKLTEEFDTATDMAVREFQRRHKLVVDGLVGIKTLGKLVKLQSAQIVTSLTFRRGDPKSNEIIQIQHWLNQTGANLKPDGVFGPATERAVIAFQQANQLPPTGIVDSKMYQMLLELPVCERTLSQDDILWAAEYLGIQVAAVMAVNEVESRGSGFFSNDRPAILYERHIMRRRLVHHKIDPAPHIARQPDIVNTATGGYLGGVREYARLDRAKAIHRPSGLESASWGLFQIMGFHWEHLGYTSAEDYTSQMHQGERQHLEAFVRFIKADRRLHAALRNLDWTTFARIYNGPAFERNSYHLKMANAFATHSRALAA